MIRKRPNQPPVCCCGEIGRRKGLKIPRWQHHTGSIPVSSTSCKTACFLAFRGTGGFLFACVKPSSQFSSAIFRLSFCQMAKTFVNHFQIQKIIFLYNNFFMRFELVFLSSFLEAPKAGSHWRSTRFHPYASHLDAHKSFPL